MQTKSDECTCEASTPMSEIWAGTGICRIHSPDAFIRHLEFRLRTVHEEYKRMKAEYEVRIAALVKLLQGEAS